MEAIKPIETEQEYRLALKKMETIFHAKPNTTEGNLLYALSLVIHEYEEKYYKIEPLTPLEALKCELEEQGLN